MEKGNPFKSRLTTLFVAFAFVIIGTLALTLMYTEAAFAAGDDATNYDYDAVASAAELETMPGVYRVRVDMNSGADPQTIGIPTVAKQNLVNAATKEMPAIIIAKNLFIIPPVKTESTQTGSCRPRAEANIR